MKNIYSYQFEGNSGMQDMRYIMKMFRCGFRTIGNIDVEKVVDHGKGEDEPAETEVLEYRLAGGSSFTIRASCAEPKLEVVVSVSDGCRGNAAETEMRICEDLDNIIYIDRRAGYCCE